MEDIVKYSVPGKMYCFNPIYLMYVQDVLCSW